MKNIHLLSFALLISLPAAATEPAKQEIKSVRQAFSHSWHKKNLELAFESYPIPFEDDDIVIKKHTKPAKKAVKSIYCPELNCWSLKDCLLHNPRHIFLTYMLNKSKRNAVGNDKPVLPMLPQELRFLIGSYAREIPTHYKIASYIQEPPTHKPNSCGTVYLSPDNTGMVLKSVAKEPNILIFLTTTEADFFKNQFKHITDQFVSYEYRQGNIEVLFPTLEEKTKDKMTLKLRNTDSNKALKAACLLPKKRKH